MALKPGFAVSRLLLGIALAALPWSAVQALTESFELPDSVAEGTTVKIDGSESMTAVNQALKQKYEQQFSGTSVELSSNGSDQALESLTSDQIDVAAIGRLLTDEEKAKGITPVILDREKIAIIVSDQNPFSGDIGYAQFAQLFRGEISNWSELGGPNAAIRFLDRPSNSDTRQSLSTYPVFEETAFETGATAEALDADDTAAMVSKLGADGVGYALYSQVKDLPGIKIIPMHKVLPNDPAYPYSQPRVLAYKGEAPGETAQSFLALATNAPGAEAVEAAEAAEAAAIAAGNSPSEAEVSVASASGSATPADGSAGGSETETTTDDDAAEPAGGEEDSTSADNTAENAAGETPEETADEEAADGEAAKNDSEPAAETEAEASPEGDSESPKATSEAIDETAETADAEDADTTAEDTSATETEASPPETIPETVPEAAESAPTPAVDATVPAEESGRGLSPFWGVLPLAALAAGGGLLWWLAAGADEDDEDIPSAVTPAPEGPDVVKATDNLANAIDSNTSAVGEALSSDAAAGTTAAATTGLAATTGAVDSTGRVPQDSGEQPSGVSNREIDTPSPASEAPVNSSDIAAEGAGINPIGATVGAVAAAGGVAAVAGATAQDDGSSDNNSSGAHPPDDSGSDNGSGNSDSSNTDSGNSGSIESVLQEDRLFYPSEEFSRNAHVKSMDDYHNLYVKAKADPEAFWADLAEQELEWFQPWEKTLEWNPPEAQWFKGGKINITHNCLDRHLETEQRNKPAIIWEGEPGDSRVLTYAQLHREVCLFANSLKKLGIKKGDVVGIYMPMIPEAAIAMLACARIGAPHSVVFGGFSAEALRDRLNDGKAKLVITADGGWRKDKIVELKTQVDKAIENGASPTVENVLVVQRTRQDIPMQEGRDHWWHDIRQTVPPTCPAEPMDSEDTLFILYTSGSTGKPKGVVHTTGGYNLYTHMTTKWIFDLREDDVYWCTADVGWITGHSYIVYGPLSNGASSLMYEGAPRPSNPGCFWDVVEKYKVSIFYTAPTAIRAFIKMGEDLPKARDLSSLRLLGTVGEPINPEAWMWYHRVIGGERCPIVDTWWQTETGGVMITALPGAIPTKPGSATLPFPGIMADVVDMNGKPVPKGEGGYLVVRHPWPSMLRTVYGDPERFRKTYWEQVPGEPVYFAGDGARIDEDGYFWVMGRVDDVISVSGHRLGTMEIESALVSHPAVAEAAVVGRPDDLKGEAVVAFVTLEGEQSESATLIDGLKQHVVSEIGALARPSEIRITDAMPKTRSGKIMRRLLRKVASGEEISGDTSTLEDRSVLDKLRSGD